MVSARVARDLALGRTELLFVKRVTYSAHGNLEWHRHAQPFPVKFRIQHRRSRKVLPRSVDIKTRDECAATLASMGRAVCSRTGMLGSGWHNEYCSSDEDGAQ